MYTLKFIIALQVSAFGFFSCYFDEPLPEESPSPSRFISAPPAQLCTTPVAAPSENCSPSQPDPAPSSPSPDPFDMPLTTALQTIEGRLPPTWQSNDDRLLFGLTKGGPGELHLLRNDLNIPSAPISHEASSLSYLVHLSDIHIVDEESPSRAFSLASFSGTIYRRNESFTPQVLHAMIQTLNRFSAFRPFDFAALTGDLIDNRQANELDWFMQTIDGGWVNPDSGDDDDPIPGENNDPNDPFFSEGLDSRVPWYSTTGNHDLLFIGNMSTDTFVGDPTRSYSAKAVIPTCLESDEEAPRPHRCVVPPLSYYSMGWIPPDPQRRPIDKAQFISRHLESTSHPNGHGFTPENVAHNTGYWVADPHPELPIRLIGLDTVAPIGSEGILDRDQIDNFLIPELQRAQEDQMLVIILTHHPSIEILRGWELRELLHQNPNVILHLAGHTHVHKIIPRPGDTPEAGYWEIQTASLIDWPLQQRLLEVVDLGNGYGEIWSTVIDFEAAENSLAAAGRFYTLFEKQDHTSLVVPGNGGQSTDRNTILRIAFPSWMLPKLDQLPKREPTSPLFQIARPQLPTTD